MAAKGSSDAKSAKEKADAKAYENAWPAPVGKTIIFIIISLILGHTWAVGMNAATGNLGAFAASIGASSRQGQFVVPIYMGAYITGIVFFTKFRTQFGNIGFSRMGVLMYWLCYLGLFMSDTPTELFVMRGLMGLSNGLITPSAVVYAMEVLPISKKMPWAFVIALVSASPMVAGMKGIWPFLEQPNEMYTGYYTYGFGLSTLALGLVWLFPVAPAAKDRMLDWVDSFSIPALLIGFCSLEIFLMMGTNFWWFNAPFLGYLLMVSLIAFCGFGIVENARRRPLLKYTLFFSRRIILLFLILFSMRIMMAAQNVLLSDVMTANNYSSRAIAPMWVYIMLAEFVGMISVGIFFINAKSAPFMVVFTLALFTVGASLNIFSSSASGPQQFIVGQLIIGYATGMFFPMAQTIGIGSVVEFGKTGIVTYLIMFLTSQLVGAMFDSAFFGTFSDFRENFHFNVIRENFDPSRPEVAEAIKSSGSYVAAVNEFTEIAKSQAAVMAYNDSYLLITLFGMAVVATTSLAFYFVSIKSQKKQEN